MSVEIIRDTQTIVRVDGEIDLSNVDQFNKTLEEAVRTSPAGFIIDLTDAKYLDTAGVHAIIVAYRKVRETDGTLVLVIGNRAIKSLLEVVRMEQLPGISTCESLDEAMKAFPSNSGDRS